MSPRTCDLIFPRFFYFMRRGRVIAHFEACVMRLKENSIPTRGSLPLLLYNAHKLQILCAPHYRRTNFAWRAVAVTRAWRRGARSSTYSWRDGKASLNIKPQHVMLHYLMRSFFYWQSIINHLRLVLKFWGSYHIWGCLYRLRAIITLTVLPFSNQ